MLPGGWQESNEKELVKTCSFEGGFADVNSTTTLYSLMALACVRLELLQGKGRTVKTFHMGMGMENAFGRAHPADFSDEGIMGKFPEPKPSGQGRDQKKLLGARRAGSDDGCLSHSAIAEQEA